MTVWRGPEPKLTEDQYAYLAEIKRKRTEIPTNIQLAHMMGVSTFTVEQGLKGALPKRYTRGR